MQTAIGEAITKVWYFRDCSTSFVVEVGQCLTAVPYAPKNQVGAMGTLSIVQRGSVARSGRILLPGFFWGEDMIVTSQFLIDDTPGTTLTYVEMLSLRKRVLNDILIDYPDVEVKIRKAAVTIAFQAAVRIVAREALMRKSMEEGEVSSQTGVNIDGTPMEASASSRGRSGSRVRGLSAIFNQSSINLLQTPTGRRNSRRQSALDLIDGFDNLSDPDREQDITPESTFSSGRQRQVQEVNAGNTPHCVEGSDCQKDQLDQFEKFAISQLAAIREEIRALNTNGQHLARSEFEQESHCQ